MTPDDIPSPDEIPTQYEAVRKDDLAIEDGWPYEVDVGGSTFWVLAQDPFAAVVACREHADDLGIEDAIIARPIKVDRLRQLRFESDCMADSDVVPMLWEFNRVAAEWNGADAVVVSSDAWMC
jgi:hypothetical protein